MPNVPDYNLDKCVHSMYSVICPYNGLTELHKHSLEFTCFTQCSLDKLNCKLRHGLLQLCIKHYYHKKKISLSPSKLIFFLCFFRNRWSNRRFVATLKSKNKKTVGKIRKEVNPTWSM